jgi:hypothetical protein
MRLNLLAMYFLQHIAVLALGHETGDREIVPQNHPNGGAGETIGTPPPPTEVGPLLVTISR